MSVSCSHVLGAALLLLVLMGCATPECVPALAPPLPATTKPIDLAPMCEKVKDYTPPELAELDAAVAALADNSPIVPVLGDYKRMRDEARACSKASRP